MPGVLRSAIVVVQQVDGTVGRGRKAHAVGGLLSDGGGRACGQSLREEAVRGERTRRSRTAIHLLLPN